MIDLFPLIDFTNLASPQELDSALAFLILTLLGLFSYSGIRLSSPAVLIMWSLTVMVLILTFITSLPFLWFWLLILLGSIVVAISAAVNFLL